MAILVGQLLAITIVDASALYVQLLGVQAMEEEGEDVIFSNIQLRQERVKLFAEVEYVVKRVSLIGCLVAFLAAHASYLSSVLDGLPYHLCESETHAVAIALGRILIAAPLVLSGVAEMIELLHSEQLPFPRNDAHNVSIQLDFW
ncbi:MAG: hypothetical protein SGPRY_008399 [Prymnesium sp.]